MVDDKDVNKDKARKRNDRAKIRQFMKAKREKMIANDRKKKEDEEKARLALKSRLMALDVKAVNAATKVRLN